MTKRVKKLLVALTIGIVLITAGIISGVSVINSSRAKRPTYVSTAEELVTAINDEIDKPIVLNNDITVHGDLTANKLFDLEMNGHDLRVIGKFTIKTDSADEMYLCDGKTQIKKREKVQADQVEIDAVNATITWNANVQLKDGYTADDFVVSAADHSFIFNGLMLGKSGEAGKTAMTVKQGRVVVSEKDEDVKAPAEIVVPSDAKDVLIENKTSDDVNIKASTSVSVSGTVSVDVDENAEDVKITAPSGDSKVTIKSGTVSSVDAAGSEVIVDKGATVTDKVTAGKVENNGTVGEIEAGEVVDNSVAIRKEDRKAELDAYARAKGKDNYTANGWEAVKAAVTAGNAAIDAAADIAGVDAAFETAKANIDAVKTIATELTEYKATKKAAIEKYATDKGEANYTVDNWTVIQTAVTSAKTAIDTAADKGAVDKAYDEAVASIDAVKTVATELGEYKATRKAALETYANGKGEANYTADNWTAIQSAVTAGKSAIDAAANEAAVDAAYDAAKANIDAVKTIAQQLADKKAEVAASLKAAYNACDLTLYRDAEKNAITAKYEELKTAIDAVTDIANLPGTFVADFNAFVAAQKTNAQLTAEELAAKKTEVIGTLDVEYAKYKEADYRAAQWKNITDAYNTAKAGINAVTVITELPGNFVATFTATASAQKTNAQLTAEELAAKKIETLNSLKTAYDGIDLTLYREAEQNAIKAKYEELKTAINAVTDIAKLPGTFVSDLCGYASSLTTDAEYKAQELAAKKTEVIGKLDEAKARYAEADYREAQWKNITDAYNTAKAGINAVTDIANLPGNFVSDFTTVADAQPTDADLTADELAAKKAEVIRTLDTEYAKYKEADYREAEWTKITEAYNTAKNGINAAEVITELPGNFVATFTATASAQKTDAQYTAEELAAKKTEVIATLDTEYAKYKEADYREAEWTKITEAYNTAKAGINAAKVITELPGDFVATFTATALAQKTDAQLTAEELAAKKTEVAKELKDAYDACDLTLYRDAEKNAITAKYEELKAAIDEVTDIVNLPGTFVADFNAFVAAQKTDAQYIAEELAAKKAEVIATLDTEYAKYDEADYRTAEWTKITEAYNTAKAGINAVTVITELPGDFVATFTATASAQKTDFELYQSEQKIAITEYADDKGEDNYSAAKWTEIREYADAACDAIDAATDKDTVDTAVADAKRSIDGVALAVVKLDGTGYDSLAEAIAELTTAEEHTIKLLADVIDTTATEYVFDGVTVTLDLNGYTMDGVAYVTDHAHYLDIKNGAKLTVTDGSEAKTGRITASFSGSSALNVIRIYGSELIINGGTISAHDHAQGGLNFIYVDTDGKITLNDGTIESLARTKLGAQGISLKDATATAIINGGVIKAEEWCSGITGAGVVTVSGGTIESFSSVRNMIVTVSGGNFTNYEFKYAKTVSITGGTFDKEVDTKYLTKGYACVENDDGTYHVENGYVVAIGNVKYDTLSEAIAAANTGDVVKIYNDITENEGNIKYIIDKAITVCGAFGTGIKPVVNGTFAIDINGVSDGSDVVTIENLEIVHNGVYVKDGWTQDTKGAVVLQDGGLTLKNNYIHLVNPAPANVSNSPSGLQLTRRGASVSTGAITVSGNTFGAYPKYSDKTNTIATAIQVSRNYTVNGVLVYGELEVDDEAIYTGNKYENTDGNAQYVLYGNFDFAADKRGYTYVVFGDVFAYNRDGGDLLDGGKMIIARSFTLTDKVYDVKAGTELVIASGATLNGNGLTLNVYGTLTVKGKIVNTNIVYGDDASSVIYLNGSEVDDSTVFDENAEYVVDITRSNDTGAFAIAAAAKVKKMTINLRLYSGTINITDTITVVSPIVVNGYGAVKNTTKKTPFNVTADTAFIVKSGSLELNKIQLKHTGTSADEKNFIVADANANVTVDLATVAFVATADKTYFFNVASGATFDLNFVDDGSTFKVNTSTNVATADVFTVTKVEDGADYVGADYYGDNFAAHNRDAYSTVNVTDKNGNSLFNIEKAIVTKGDETPTYYVATGAGLKTAIASGADYVKLMDDVVGTGESDTGVTIAAVDGDLETVIDLNGKQFGYELNLSTIRKNEANKYEDTGYTLKVTIKNGKIGTESGYNQDAEKGMLVYGVLCQGNGVDLALENVESSAYYGGLYANGAWKDNVITATDCKFTSTIAGYGAYLPGKNTYNFTSCVFSGSVGVYIKSGDVTFTDCTIEGKGEYLKPTYNGNGADGEGSGLVVDSTTGYQAPMTVTVNGGTITSANGYAIEEVSNAKANANKICYSTVTVSKETVLTGKLGKVSSENGTVKVENTDGTVTAYASTGAGVANAIVSGEKNVKLTDDVLGEGSDTDVTVAADEGNVETTIDLNGKQFGYELNLSTIRKNEANKYEDTGYTLKVTIKNGKIGTENGYSNEDADGKKSALFYGLLLEGDGLDVTLENVESSAYYGGLYMNGSWKDYKVVANDCVFNCVAGNAAYFAGYTVAEFNNCTFSGSMGAYAKSGDITFNDCTLTGKLPYEKPTYNGSGANGEGNGFTADSCVGYQQPLDVKFNGGSITSVDGYAIEEISTAKAGVEKVCYSTVYVSKETVLTGKLGKVQSENGTVKVEGEDGTVAAYASTADGLVSAAMEGGKVVLTDSIESVGKSVQTLVGATTANVETEIDLNGNTLGYRLCTTTSADGVIDTGYRLKITVKNGQIGTDTGFNADGGELIYGINMQGNGVDLVLENVKVVADYGALYANGRWSGSTVKATNCEFVAAGTAPDALAAVLMGNTAYTFDKCKFVGPCGVYMKSGDYTFTDCEIESTGAYYKPTYQGNGTNNAGSAVVVDNCTGYHKNLNVSFVNCKITSANGYAIEELSTAKAGLDKVVYADVTVDAKSVLTGKLGKVSSENGTVRVEGENGETTAYASTGAGVVNAMANGGTVVLTDDVTGEGKDTDVTIAAVDGNVETTLDLNGKTLGYELNLSTLTEDKDNGNTLKVTIKNGKIGTESGYSNEDADGTKGQLYYGLLLEGNGLDVTLENVESSAYYGGLYMNGTWKNYKVVANDCVFNCVAGNAAYFAGYTVAEFNNCKFSGSMGAYAKCGDITFNNCELTGKLPYEKPTYNGNGANGEGNGFTADSCVGYQQPLTVKFNGGSITSEYGYAIEELSTAKEGVEKVCYSTVTVSKETVLTGKLGKVQSENGTVKVEGENGTVAAYVSSVNALTAALASEDADEVVVTKTLNVLSDETLDLNGKKIVTDSNLFIVRSGATLTINGDGYVRANDGTKGYIMTVVAGGKIVINGGTYSIGAASDGSGNSCIYAYGGDIEINGGIFSTDVSYDGKYYVLNINNEQGGSFTVTGGTFVNYNPETGDDNLGGNFVPDGYTSVMEEIDGVKYYTVQENA